MIKDTQNWLISGRLESSYLKCVAAGAHSTMRILSKCIRIFVLAKLSSPEMSSTRMGSILSKG